MSWYSFVAVVAAVLYACVGVLVIRAQSAACTNRLFAFCCALFSLWAAAFAFLSGTDTVADVWLWYRVGAPGWTITPALLLHFFVCLTEFGVFSRWRLGLAPLYVPGIVFLGATILSPATFVHMTYGPIGWTMNPRPGIWVVAYTAYYLLYVAAALLITHRWGHCSGDETRSRQARAIVVSGAVSVGLTTVVHRLLPYLGVPAPVPIAPLLIGIWVAGIGYALSRHGLIMLTPGTAAEEILATMSDAVLLVGPDNRVTRVNPAAERLFGMENKVLLGSNIKDLLPFEDVTASQVISKTRLTDAGLRHEAWVQAAGGKRTPVDVATATVRGAGGRTLGVVAILRDMSERRRAEDQLKHLANHDMLTNLPNRLLLHDRLAQALARSRRHKNPVGVLVLDLDHFKEVNDTLGHDHGDALLQAAAQRLVRCVRECDTVARLGGDEFVVVAGELLEPGNVEVIARRIVAAFERPFDVKGREIRCTPSIGASIFPQDAESADELLRLADVAMYVSKSRGRGTYTMFERSMLRTVERRKSIESQLREALDRGAFSLLYLPFCDLRTGRVAGLEALVRWEHPALGEVAPGEFMPVAEGAGLVPEIDRWVLRSACGQLAAWRAEGLAQGVFVAVNVSARQVLEPGFPDHLKGALAGAGLSPQDLQVEIAESVLAQGGAHMDGALQQIKQTGVRVALDDYGAGYSWLTRLGGLAVDTLKVDRSLVQGMTRDPRLKVIVQALVAVGHSIGKQVVAEGVETREQLEALQSLSSDIGIPLICDLAQGYLFAQPAPAKDIPALMARVLIPKVPNR